MSRKASLCLRRQENVVIIKLELNEIRRATSIGLSESDRRQIMKNAKMQFDYNLFLIGFMGTGKSTVAHCLKMIYGMDVVEMDQEIANREGMSIPDIFASRGEDYFRSLESALLKELRSRTNTVVSCGGGAAMRAENVTEMKKNGRVVLLTATPETVYERVKDSDERPVLNGNKNTAYIAELMEKRQRKYEGAADIIVSTDKKSEQEICKEIIIKLAELGEYDV